jgi:hypothetical protein
VALPVYARVCGSVRVSLAAPQSICALGGRSRALSLTLSRNFALYLQIVRLATKEVFHEGRLARQKEKEIFGIDLSKATTVQIQVSTPGVRAKARLSWAGHGTDAVKH